MNYVALCTLAALSACGAEASAAATDAGRQPARARARQASRTRLGLTHARQASRTRAHAPTHARALPGSLAMP